MYCTDTFLDVNDPVTQQITVESLQRKNKVIQDQRKATPKASPMKASPAKSESTRGNAMESEKYM